MKKLFSLFLLCTTIAFVSCQEADNSPTTIPVSGISMNKTELTMLENSKETLIATIAPENATNKEINWSSNAEDIAIVSQTGEVTAIKEGTATIIITTKDGGKTAICKVKVSAPILVSGLTLNKKDLLLGVGEKETLILTIAPENATDKNVIWSSNAEDVVSVSETGEMTALKEGTATITVTSVGDKTKSASCKVDVLNSIPINSITLNKKDFLLVIGKKETLIATIAPENASNKNVTWTSSNEEVATVSETGEVTALKEGTTKIQVITEEGKKAAFCDVLVVPENTTRCQIVNFITPMQSSTGANGTLYEAAIIFYEDTEISTSSVGDIATSGKSSERVAPKNATRVRVSFKLALFANTDYTVDFFSLNPEALTTVTITDDTIINSTKEETKGGITTIGEVLRRQ